MATFLILIEALVLLLGSLDGLKENHRVTLNPMYGTVIAQEADRSEQKALPCPWQLEFITLRTNEEIARAPMSDNQLPSKE
jgi:hypothetical protein